MDSLFGTLITVLRVCRIPCCHFHDPCSGQSKYQSGFGFCTRQQGIVRSARSCIELLPLELFDHCLGKCHITSCALCCCIATSGTILLFCVCHLIPAVLCVLCLDGLVCVAKAIVGCYYCCSVFFHDCVLWCLTAAVANVWILAFHVQSISVHVLDPMLYGHHVTWTTVVCKPQEFDILQSPSGMTCQELLGPFIDAAGGYLQDLNATSDCGFCRYSVVGQCLSTINIKYSYRRRNVGFICVYILINVSFMLILYYLMRVKSIGPFQDGLSY